MRADEQVTLRKAYPDIQAMTGDVWMYERMDALQQVQMHKSKKVNESTKKEFQKYWNPITFIHSLTELGLE